MLHSFIKDCRKVSKLLKMSKNWRLEETGSTYDKNVVLLRQSQTKCLEQGKKIQ